MCLSRRLNISLVGRVGHAPRTRDNEPLSLLINHLIDSARTVCSLPNQLID